MTNTSLFLKRTAIGLAAIVQLLFFPVITFAETPSTQPSGTTATTKNATPGPNSPTGAAAHTYTFNPKTGLWENEHYTWDPKTNQTRSKKNDLHNYNPHTGTWDTKEWKYDAPSKTYKPHVVSQDKQPAATSDSKAKAQNPSAKQKPFNTSQTQNNNQSNTLNNTITTQSESGNAAVKNNGEAGSATTGNAQATSNTLSMLQSSWGLQGSKIATFDTSIHGNIKGDILLDPATLATNGLKLATASPSNLKVNVKDSGTINNDIIVDAKSGNADVVSNTSAGDAKTGDATALANVINVINSAINTGQSFVGNINIHGSLEGDILLPDALKRQLAKSDTAPTTQLDTKTLSNGEVLQEFANSQNIRNNVNLSAHSGKAANTQNTLSGGAVSGDGKTNLTLLNLTGREVIGSNALLVFVNVLGKWTGMIVDAPTGATTGMLGNHATRQLPTGAAGNISADHNHTINNNITARARTGDATISQNTQAGNAQSGNARAGVNLLNITNSQFSLADWFGVLFINVFGSWSGSFGVDTAAGSQPNQPTLPSNTAPIKEVKVYELTASAGGTKKIVPVSASKPTSPLVLQSTSVSNPEILGSAGTKNNWPKTPQKSSEKSSAMFMPAVIAILVGAGLLLLERIISRRTKSSFAA